MFRAFTHLRDIATSITARTKKKDKAEIQWKQHGVYEKKERG